MLAPAMTQRALALALALLLLLTQQLGVQHRWSHDLGLPAAALSGLAFSEASPARADVGLLASDQAGDQPGDQPTDSGTGAASDSHCQVCLVLAALAVAALPGLLRWALQRQPLQRALAWRARPPQAVPRRRYQARAPPA